MAHDDPASPRPPATRPGGLDLHKLREGARNAAELLSRGRLGAPYRASHELVVDEPMLRLRRYRREDGRAPEPGLAPVLLVPPLMVTAEVYDISPELSAVAWLAAQGLDVWVADFGVPEDEDGGLDRTLDDHVLTVDRALTVIADESGHATAHLAGYSQGGMFAYQAAAYRRGEGIASVITFGSPVDMRRNLPVKLDDTLAEQVISVARSALDGPIRELEGLPGTLTSRGFKLMSPRQEVKHLVGLLGLLHDREALERREPKRRFLGGEGFIAWPGPAFRKMVDELIVGNRMATGGFVIAGRTVSLADLQVPILYVVGTKDDMARPGAVRAIRKAAPNAEHHELKVRAGHFGLVVGSRALGETWPTVAEWVAWRAGLGDVPRRLVPETEDWTGAAAASVGPDARPEPPAKRLYDLATDVVDGLWHRLGESSVEVTSVVGSIRWQLPRLARLMSLRDSTRVSTGRLLREQAKAIGDQTFFLWKGRAYSYAEADDRVDRLALALYDAGVRRGQHVGVLMDNHPDYLGVTAALSRLGAVGVLLNADARGKALAQAVEAGAIACAVADPAHVEALHAEWPEGHVLVCDHGRRTPAGELGDAKDLEVFVDGLGAGPVAWPAGLRRNPGQAQDLALLMFTSGTTGGLPKAARITNRRMMAAALGGAAACELRPVDTVYCCLPLHHATGMLVACGAALAGGSRLALAPKFSVSTFWEDVRRYGASVVFYVGELCRYLVTSPVAAGEGTHPVRLFVGNGMRPDVWKRLQARFGGVRVLEFYGSTEGNVVLANLTGDKVGSVGRPLLGPGEVALARWDVAAQDFVRDPEGVIQLVPDGEAGEGVLIGRVADTQPLARFDGYVDDSSTRAKTLRHVREPGDAWFVTGDVLRRDDGGDYWFVDRVGETFRWKGENVSTQQVAEVLCEDPAVTMAAVYGVTLPGREGRAGMAAVTLADGEPLDGARVFGLVSAHLTPPARPRFVRVVAALETTGSHKLRKAGLQAEGADPGRIADAIWWLDEEAKAYVPLDLETYASLTVSHEV